MKWVTTSWTYIKHNITILHTEDKTETKEAVAAGDVQVPTEDAETPKEEEEKPAKEPTLGSRNLRSWAAGPFLPTRLILDL